MKTKLGQHSAPAGTTKEEMQEQLLNYKLARVLLTLGVTKPLRTPAAKPSLAERDTTPDPIPAWRPTTVRTLADVQKWAAAHHFRLPYLVRVWPEVASYKLVSTGHEFYPVCTDGTHVWGETALGPREVHATNVERLEFSKGPETTTAAREPRAPKIKLTPAEELDAKLAAVLAQLGITAK